MLAQASVLPISLTKPIFRFGSAASPEKVWFGVMLAEILADDLVAVIIEKY